MGDVLNFRKARKTFGGQLHQQQAATNRLKHGRSKAERNLEATRKTKTRHHLDLHRVDTGDEG